MSTVNSEVGARPRIGLLGITQSLYDDVVEGITDYHLSYGFKLVSRLDSVVDLVFERPAKDRRELEKIVSEFESSNLDGILIVMFTYAPSQNATRALLETRLPIMLANIQPVQQVEGDWDMNDLTYNQGIHGAQDMMNNVKKLGLNCPVFTGDWRSSDFLGFVEDWARAARTVGKLKKVRIASFGQMPGMGDITTEPNAFMRTFGPAIEFCSAGSIYNHMSQVSSSDVDRSIAEDHANFDVAVDLPKKSHQEATRLYLGLKRFLEREGYDGFSVHFDAMANDGRFEQLHMLAASKLLAEGHGYAAEGDVMCASLAVAANTLIGDAHFTEMYAMDFHRQAVLMSHMGEGNWKVARRDRKPRLINRRLDIGGLQNPPTIVFSAQPGPATLVSLATVGRDKYRFVMSTGEVLDEEQLPRIEMPHYFYRPSGNLSLTVNRWLELGGTHHQIMNLGDHLRRWKLLASLLGVDLEVADRVDG